MAKQRMIIQVGLLLLLFVITLWTASKLTVLRYDNWRCEPNATIIIDELETIEIN